MSNPRGIRHPRRRTRSVLSETVRAHQEWLDVALKAAEVGAWAWTVNHDPKVTRTAEYDRIFGISSSKRWTRSEWLKAIHSEDRERTNKAMGAVISGEQEEYSAEYRIIRPNGEIRWINGWGKNIRDASGRVIRITGIIKDISARKRVEQERDQYIAILSHDLRNPLAAARVNAELLKQYADRIRNSSSLLKKIVSSVDRADRLIQDLLDSSRVRSGRRLSLKMERSDINEIITETLEELRDIYGERVDFKSSGRIEGLWSRNGIARLLENLVGNAIKYGSEDTPVNVTLEHMGDSAVLSVHNSGTPIPSEEVKTLFEPFQRARAVETGWKQGWGLGLTVVHGVALAHGGRVDVHSDSESGTSFTVILPLSPELPAIILNHLKQ